MKYVLILFGILLTGINHAQETCFAENLMMYDQDVATNFSTDYPDCTIILGDVILQGNENFLGMEQIVEIQGTIRCGGDGECNGQQANFLGLENVTSLGGINLEENNFSLAGLSSVAIITGDFRLEECSIIDFFSLTNLIEIGGDFNMSETTFESFNGLQNLASVGENFKVDENAMLLNSNSIESLVSVGGSFQLSECNIIDGFTGFAGLTSVGGNFIIDDCPMVTSLDGFENITSISGLLQLIWNDMLTDIFGIANIDPESISFAEIRMNPLLSMCSVTSICQHLIDEGDYFITINNDGCNSRQEILEQCANSVFSDASGENSFGLVNTIVNSELRIANPLNRTFSILDGTGRILLTSSSADILFLGHLAAGVYFVKVEGGEALHKFVKQH